jgi:RecB family exonuclease
MPEELLKLSVSKTKTFLDCAKKFHFSYVLKLPKKEYEFHTFGKFLHKVLEDFHLKYLNGENVPFHTTMTEVYKNAFLEYKDKLSKELKSEAFEIINQYLKLLSKDKTIVSKVSDVEKKFELNINDKLILNGMIDRIQLDDDGVIHVCDYKTTKNKKYMKNDFMQLLTYAYILYKDNPTLTKVRGSYIMLRHNFEFITKEFSLEDILSIEEKYLGYADDISSELLWRASPTKLCDYCDFLDSCEEGKKFLNKGIKTGLTSW